MSNVPRNSNFADVYLGKPRSELNPAQWMYERLARQIIGFEKELTVDEEIGGQLVASPGEGFFHIEDLGFWGPDMTIFYGKNTHRRPVQLLQHYSQLSVLLTALPEESASAQPRRIGFNLEQKLKDGKPASK